MKHTGNQSLLEISRRVSGWNPSTALVGLVATLTLLASGVQAATVSQAYGSFPADPLAVGAPAIWESHSTGPTTSASNGTPNDSNLLLGFTVQMPNTLAPVTYSTGVNDAALSANAVSFTPLQFRALPVLQTPVPLKGTYVGIAANWDGQDQSLANSEVPSHPERPLTYYLTNSTQGLELGTAVFNLPNTAPGYVTFAIDGSKIDPVDIGDGIPDIIVTQVGDPGTSDTFQFYSGSTALGAAYAASFNVVTPLGKQDWDFYGVTVVPPSYQYAYVSSLAGLRDTRILALDYADLGITATNAAQVTELRQNLSGQADIAFVAYNTASVPAVLPELSLRKSPDAFTVELAEAVGYDLTVQNLSPFMGSFQPITVTDTVTTGVGFVSAAGAGWVCSFTAPTITCTTEQILATGATAVPIAVQLTAPTTTGAFVGLPAQVSGGGDETCPREARCQATATITVPSLPLKPPPELTLSKTVDHAQLMPGDTATYTLSVSNANVVTPSSGTITAIDILPAGLTLASASGSGWACSSASRTVTCTSEQSIASASAAPAITVTATVDAAARGTLTNSAQVSGGNDSACPVAQRCQASATAQVQAASPIAVTPVPTLDRWALMLLSTTLAAFAALGFLLARSD